MKIKPLNILLSITCFLCVACNTYVQKSPQPNELTQPNSTGENPEKSNLTSLDVLTEYDRDIWGGPDAWDDEQWQWKKRLRWGKACDYVGDIELFSLSKKHQLIKVLCVPGAYQETSYLFLYDRQNKVSKQLALGRAENPKEIIGRLVFTEKNKTISILTLSRGVGDCGVYRVFSFEPSQYTPILVEQRARACSEKLLPKNSPKEIFNPKKWPLVKR